MLGLSRSLRRSVVAAVAAASFLLSLPAAGSPALVARLERGDAVLWDEREPVSGSAELLYRLEVVEPARLLRVALDHSDLDNSWTLRVEDPDGSYTVARGPYSMEAFVRDPAPGEYVVHAVPTGVRDSVVRFRAKLEGARPTRSLGTLLPNLRIAPPYELSLDASPWYTFGYGPGSCFPEETAEHGATRCLRFSFGPENAGRGPLELVFASPAREGGAWVMYQRLHLADGRTKDVPAGTYEYHPAHAHYHHPLIAGQRLFRVADPATGALQPAGEAKKTGFCMGDYLLVDWERFYQAPINSVESQCSIADAPVRDMVMGLSTGWADIYYYGLEGNFVDFSDHGDGRYVLRGFTDRRGLLRETDERDNVSYAYFEVRGSDITLIERGYGTDPWDPRKVVVDDPRNFATP